MDVFAKSPCVCESDDDSFTGSLSLRLPMDFGLACLPFVAKLRVVIGVIDSLIGFVVA